MSVLEWCQFKLWYGKNVNLEELYTFRKSLFPILDRYAIENFLVLNEPEAMYFRVEAKTEHLKEIGEALNTLVTQSGNLFSNVTFEKWDPEQDAQERILRAAQHLGLKLEDRRA